MAATFLVTGAAGFIGSHSVERLLAEGHNVVAVDNLRSGRLENLAAALATGRCHWRQLDVTDEAALHALFRERRFDGVLHLAALVSVVESFEQPTLNARINLYATDTVARLCLEHSCPRLVFASSAAVYGNPQRLPNREDDPTRPLSPYGAAKLAAEDMLLGYARSYGLQTVCLRYFNVYGPCQDPSSPYSGVLSIFARRFRDGQPVTVYGDGEQTRDFVAVQDVARVNSRALTQEQVESGCYNVCHGRPVSLNEVLAVFRERYPGAPPARYEAARPGDIRHSAGDPGRLAQFFTITLGIALREGLHMLLNVEEKL
ncbi:MAG TPA: SDR family NAD(P)-dependent oxidoreductase [Candidatus Competibacteraceae bacterium]|nr:SDR family NAD(P)-dependent oxidoreductase [Candidatus Competibacteraceae bacterium]